MTLRLAFVGLPPALIVFGLAATAQTPTAQTSDARNAAVPSYTQGNITATFHKFLYTPTDTLLSEGVTLTAPDYDMQAPTVKIYTSAAKGAAQDIAKIVADGDLPHGVQVIGHYNSADQGRYYTTYSDHAVYVPDNSRPDGGSVDLIGHPKLVIRAPAALAEPSTTVAKDHIHIVLGRGQDYPTVSGEDGRTTFVPLH